MTLSEWMEREGLGDEQLAVALGVDRSTASRYRRGRRMPSPEIMRQIRAATKGAVTANDFVHTESRAA